MGAVSKVGAESITITGVENLHGATHNVVQDRIEAGTFMVAAAMTGGDVLDSRCYLGTQTVPCWRNYKKWC